MKWIDLKDYGADLKRVELPNGQVYPALIINDVEKFNNSGAVTIQQLRENNPTLFEKLGGDSKGRPLNKPVFFLSNSFDKNQSKYALTPALSQLLQIPESAVVSMYKDMNPNDITVQNGLADFDKLNQISNKSTQTYMGKGLYIVKDKSPTESLITFAEKLEENQHPLYQKNNVANFPFEALDKFGFNTDIIERAFLNPQDALRSGFTLDALQFMQVTDQAILPISMNQDSSINLITHASDISQLAYTNYKWQKNIPIIEDYNALLAVREATRTALNVKQVDVNSPEKFNDHINNIAIALQNFNESTSVNKTHKPIKYDNQGVVTMLTQNKQGEWRYIEKSGSKKLDEPLTLPNFEKALTAVAKSSYILSEAMSLKPNSLTFEEALNKVLTTQAKIYKAHTLVVNENNVDAPNPNNKVIINTLGDKVNIHTLNSSINTFQRDNGASLSSEAIKSIIGDMRSTERGTINDIMGGAIVDPMNIMQNTVAMPVDPVANPQAKETPKAQPTNNLDAPLDILDIADQVMRDAPKTEPKEVTFKVPLPSDYIASNTPKVVEPTQNYANLPKGITSYVDENYDQVNDIYRTIQHLATTSVPYWSLQLENAQSALKEQDYNLMYKHEREIKAMLNESSAEFSNYPTAFNEKKSSADLNLNNIVTDLNLIITNELIKQNMLSLRLNDIIGDKDLVPYGVVAIKSDKDGNFVPFDNQSEYESTVQKIKNNSITNLQNESLNGLLPSVPTFESSTKEMVDNFVNHHYNNQKINFDQINTFSLLENRQTFIANFASVEHKTYSPALPYSQSAFDLQLLEQVATIQPNSFQKQANSIISDMVFGNSMTASYDNFPPTNSPELNYKFYNFEKNPNALSNLEKFEILDQAVKNAVGRLKANPELEESQKFATDALMYKIGTVMNSTKQHLILDVGLINSVGNERFLSQMSASFLLNTQTLNDPSNTQKDGVFAYSTTGENAYKVVKVQEVAPDQNALRSTTYADSLKEVYSTYQFNKITSELGISTNEIPIIKQLTQELRKDPTSSAVSQLTTQLTGNDTNSLGKALDYNYKLSTSVALAYKMSGVENDQIKPHSLITKIDDLSNFKNAYNYLATSFHEATRTTNELGADSSKDKPTQLIDNAITALNDKNEDNVLKITNKTNVAFVTVLPSNDLDDRYSRIVPVEWLDKDKPNPNLAISVLLTEKPFPLNPVGLQDIAKEHAVATIPEPKQNEVLNENEIQAVVEKQVQPETHYPDTFNRYDTFKLASLDQENFSELLSKNALWEKASLSDHVFAKHQNLDTMILSNALHASLNNLPISNNNQITTNYRDHYLLLKQVHDVVANSKDNQQLLENFHTFAHAISAQNPTMLQINSEIPLKDQTQTIMLNCLKNASYNHVVKGMDANEAINQAFTNDALNARIAVQQAIVPTITEIARQERLNLNEKSFVNYLDGLTLNSPDSKKLSDALLTRISDAPVAKADLTLLNNIKPDNTNIIIPKLIEDINNSINPTSEKELKQSKNDISQKWNIHIQADGCDRDLFTKKQLDQIENNLTQIQKAFNIQDTKSVGNGMVVDTNLSDKNFVKEWATNLINTTLDLEASSFTPEQRTHYISKNPFNSPMIEMIKKEQYEPNHQSTHTFVALSDLTHKEQESKVSVSSYIQSSKTLAEDAYYDYQASMKKSDVEFELTNKFIAFTVNKIESNQAKFAQDISKEAQKAHDRNPDATDLYHHKIALESHAEKIINPKISVSTVSINNFLAVEMPTVKNDQKEQMSDLIKAQFEMLHDVREQASAYLSAKGANLVIQSIVDTAPESIKSSDQNLINEIDKKFGAILGESSNLDKIEKGDSFAVKYNGTDFPFDHEAIVAKYISEIVNDSGKYNIPNEDKDRTKQLVISLVDEVHASKAPKPSNDLDKDKENSLVM